MLPIVVRSCIVVPSPSVRLTCVHVCTLVHLDHACVCVHKLLCVLVLTHVQLCTITVYIDARMLETQRVQAYISLQALTCGLQPAGLRSVLTNAKRHISLH